ncbi:MAG TPA: sigma 54-interacting transcriptional regulator [Tepidisphaeraceae bacterium]|jgi:PAS domain S-box-containing protein
MTTIQHVAVQPPSASALSGEPIRDVAPSELVVLRAIVEGTVASTGDAFFQTLVQHLALALGVQNAFVAEFCGPKTVRTLGFWQTDGIVPNAEWDVAGTPCEEVVRGQLCHYPRDISKRFPLDAALVDCGIESYLGVPLIDDAGQHLGHLAVYDQRPMPEVPGNLMVFKIFATRAAAELARLRDKQRLAESEQRFRDLFDEAPIAYVHEALDSRFLSANHAAMQALGLTSTEVPGILGQSLLPDVPEAKQRYADAFAAIKHVNAVRGVVLELRRKDNGEPVWVQWWSKPDPGGQYTRTMFVNITDRVRVEQEKKRLEEQNLYLREEIQTTHNFEGIVGRSPALLSVLEDVRSVAQTDTSVLICGETGTGKEVIARAVHNASNRRDKSLIKVNCAALPAGLVESELFGHERGAFSGAIMRRIGRFELAQGGTIFLDEIGDLPLDVQAKLLRVLQEREFDRVGGVTIKADARVIAATNRDSKKAVAEGTFRKDLYYRGFTALPSTPA